MLFSSYKLLSAGDDDEDEDLSDNAIVKFCKQVREDKQSGSESAHRTALFEGHTAYVSPPLLISVATLHTQFISTTDSYDGNNFWTTMADGARVATPLLLALAVVEIGDVVLAVDSRPAGSGITVDPVSGSWPGSWGRLHAWC